MTVNLVLVVCLFAIGANATFYSNNPYYCYSLDPLRNPLQGSLPPQVGLFSTTTPYVSVRGSPFNPSICTPERLWLISRHGSRYPSLADSDQLLSPTDPIQSEIIQKYNSRRTTLCTPDAENIKKWTLDPIMLRTDGPADLSATGRNELITLAKRYQSIFAGLLPKTYSEPHYFFRNSPILRTRQTAQAFAEGLFGSTGSQQVNYTGGTSPDVFMLSFSGCQAWINLVYSGSAGTEAQAFADGPEFQEMITQVSDKLGFYGSERLNQTEIVKLMTHCQYEQILDHTKSSPFCSIFSPANVQVYEYYKDLQFYYMSGYGYKDDKTRALYKNMNCYLVQDMLNFLQAKDSQKAKLSFGHDVTVQFLMVSLGLFNDTVPLTSKNFEKQALRSWRTSLITPMGANLVVVRYDCKIGEDEVLFMLNEKPLQIPGCNSLGICKISVVQNRLSYFSNCDQLFCKN